MMRTVSALAFLAVTAAATAQGTKLWTTDRYETLERGTTSGAAIRNDGRLSPAPATALAFTSSSNYIWSIAGDAAGNAYLGTGGSASGAATVLRVTPDGKSTKIFEGKELGVQSIRLAPDNTLYVATNPDGKIYRVSPSGGPPIVVFDPASTPEKSKYLWDLAVSKTGDLYVAAGAPAAVYRIAQNKPELLFRTADQHIRSLLLAHDGQLWAGTDGGGVVYRFDAKANKPFAMYAATEREITALAEDATGNVYASAVGSKSTSSLPPLPVTGAVGVTVTFVQPGSAGAVQGNSVIPEGSVLYRIAPDGAPSKLLALKEDIVYGLAVKDGALIATTGNRGRVYSVDLATPGRFSDIAHLEASQGTALASTPNGDLLIATSNSGKLYRLGGPAKTPTYTSEVFDAGGLSRWGRPEVRTATPYTLSLRVGNVPSPAEGWSDWIKLDTGAKIPPARFAQWKLDLSPTSSIEAVAINYLPRNVAPVVDDIVVQIGARVQSTPAANAVTTVQIPFPTPPPANNGFTLPGPDTSPLTGQKDRSAITVRWAAHDDNGDDLMFAVWFKGVAETNFHLLKDNLSDRFLSFDAATLPDGPYVLKVVASDGPSHPDPETLTAQIVSAPFVIDTTAPVVANLHATLEKTSIAATCEATDATSPISHAEYSLDAGPWQYLEPVGTLSDAPHETYSFKIPLDPKSPTSEHVLAVRVYDRFENLGSAKVLIH